MNDEWEVIEVGEPLEESYPQAGVRNIARTGSRVAETLGSLPRTAIDIGESIFGMLPNFISPETQKEIYPEALKNIYQQAKSFVPTSEDIRSGIGQLAPEGYLEPQNKGEELSDEIFSDLASLMVPIGPLAGVKPLKALGIAGASNLASYFAKERGYGETAQKGVKLGTTLLTSLGLGGSLRKKADELYKVAEESIRPNERIGAESIQKMLNKVTKEYASTGLSKAAGKEQVTKVVDEISSFIHADKIGLNDLWQIKKDMREAINLVDPRSKAGVELSKLGKGLDNALKNSSNKEFSSAIKAADELWGGVKRSEKINDFVKSALSNKFTKTGGVVSLLTNPVATLTSIVKATPYAIPAGAVGFGAAHGSKAIYNIFKSPAIRNEYGAMIKAAVKENAPLVVKHAEKLNKSLAKVNPMFNEDEWEEI